MLGFGTACSQLTTLAWLRSGIDGLTSQGQSKTSSKKGYSIEYPFFVNHTWGSFGIRVKSYHISEECLYASDGLLNCELSLFSTTAHHLNEKIHLKSIPADTALVGGFMAFCSEILAFEAVFPENFGKTLMFALP